MTDDPRCCGSGTCIIDPQGKCWCGQQWDTCATGQPTGDEVNAVAAEPDVSKSNP